MKFLFIVILIFITVLSYVIIRNLIDGEKQMTKKVLLIGIDAMDPKIVEKLMEEGRLPNFKKLKESGGYSRLQTTMPPESPVAWSAAATGSNPGTFGIFDFVSRDPDTYLLSLTMTEFSKGLMGATYKSGLKGTPFWRITSDHGIPTTVIRWPVTFPAEKINGRMLSGLGALDIKGFSNSYSFYTSENLEKKPEDTGKIISVSKQEGEIETVVFGPFTKRGNDTVEVQAPMRITFNADRAIVRVDDSEYEVQVNGWSDWIRVKFKIDFTRDVYGIFKVYLLSVEPEFNMYVTSIQIDPENQMVDITYPKDYGKELASEVGLFYTLGMSEDTKAVNEGRIGKQIFLEQVKDIEESRTKMFWYEFNRFEEGIYAFVFDAGDRLQHIFWENKILTNSDDEIRISQEIESYYVEKDAFLGEVLDKIDSNTLLMVFSDHGFSSFERSVSINTWLVENGYMTLTQKPDENDPGGLFKYVDWNKTKAYSFGFSSIYLNIKGRENKGIVDAEEKDKLIYEIIEKLSQLTDLKTGKRVIAKLYKGEEIYRGEYAKDAPDIVVGFERGYRMSWENALGGSTSEVFSDNERAWGGDHLIDKSHVPGIIFTNFKIATESPDLIDIAPTILLLLGLDAPRSMEGESFAH